MFTEGEIKMRYVKEGVLGVLIGSGIILIFMGFQALKMGNNWFPAYFMVGAILAVGFIKVALKVLK